MVPQLPPEIWRLVFVQLSSEASGDTRERLNDFITYGYGDVYTGSMGTRTLWRLCKVSRGFAALAQPELFRVYEPVNAHTSSALPRHVSFFQTILARPDLAAYVREIYLCSATFIEKSPCANGIYQQMATRLGLDAAVLRPKDNGSSVEGLYMLAVLLMPNVEVLWVKAPLLPKAPAPGFLEQIRTLSVVKPLERLRDLTLERDRGIPTLQLSHFFPLLALTPNITALRLDHCTLDCVPDGEPGQTRRLQQYVKNMPRGIKTLEIWHSFVPHETMGALLAHLNSLETFHYKPGGTWRVRDLSGPTPDEVSPMQLLDHLRHSQDTLQEVRISFRESVLFSNKGDGSLTETNFADFPCLRVCVLGGRELDGPKPGETQYPGDEALFRDEGGTVGLGANKGTTNGN
ncbi:hypothetical protein PG984_000136 [Apiospora sp. TS-2023a]